jgi:hypothetical protein
LTQLFSDGFESGDFSAWSGTQVGGAGASLTVENLNPHHGTYNEKAVVGTQAGSYAQVYKAFTQTTVFAREYVKFTATPSTNGDATAFIDIRSSLNYQIARVGIRKDPSDSTVKWWIRYSDGGQLNNDAYYAGAVSTDTWYCLEVKIVANDASNGEYRVYIDGTERITLTGKNTSGATDIGSLRTGVNHYNPSSSFAQTAYIDCVVVADAYIGPETTVTLQTVADTLTLNEGVLRNKVLSIADTVGLQDSQVRDKSLLLLDHLEIDDLVQALKSLAVSEVFSLADTASTPSRIMRITEEISLAEVAIVGEGGARKTKLFLVLGELAFQLTGD